MKQPVMPKRRLRSWRNQTTRTPKESEGQVSERRCVVTRQCRDTSSMIRFVRGPDGDAVPDLEEKLPGRGAWVVADREALAQMQKRNPFPRAFKAETRLADDLPEVLVRLLRRKCLELLGLARSAGQVVTGLEKVTAHAMTRPVGAMVVSSDAGPGAVEKATRLAGSAPVIDCFDRDELGLALGLDNMVHAAIAPGRLAARLLREVERLSGVQYGTRQMHDERQAIDE